MFQEFAAILPNPVLVWGTSSIFGANIMLTFSANNMLMLCSVQLFKTSHASSESQLRSLCFASSLLTYCHLKVSPRVSQKVEHPWSTYYELHFLNRSADWRTDYEPPPLHWLHAIHVVSHEPISSEPRGQKVRADSSPNPEDLSDKVPEFERKTHHVCKTLGGRVSSRLNSQDEDVTPCHGQSRPNITSSLWFNPGWNQTNLIIFGRVLSSIMGQNHDRGLFVCPAGSLSVVLPAPIWSVCLQRSVPHTHLSVSLSAWLTGRLSDLIFSSRFCLFALPCPSIRAAAACPACPCRTSVDVRLESGLTFSPWTLFASSVKDPEKVFLFTVSP